jgi:hypothetical protein
MSSLFPDTSPESEGILLALLRHATPWRKMQMVTQLNQVVCDLALCGLRKRYPHASQQEIRRLLADLVLGPELAQRVYGPLSGEPHDP